MLVNKKYYSSIWRDSLFKVYIIDQRHLPHLFKIVELTSLNDFECAIKEMWVRGAPLIGVTAAYGIAVCMKENSKNNYLEKCISVLKSTRPTAVNLNWALEIMKNKLSKIPEVDRANKAFEIADNLAREDIESNKKIGINGLKIIKKNN